MNPVKSTTQLPLSQKVLFRKRAMTAFLSVLVMTGLLLIVLCRLILQFSVL